jgi:DNA uptake protein ComE-like DNA-binding protein
VEKTAAILNPHARMRGMALVAVLAVLVTIAILAAMFTVHMSAESTAGITQKAKVQSDLLAHSALEHALSLLQDDAESSPAWDENNEMWSAAFRPDPGGTGVDIDGLYNNGINNDGCDGRWIYVRDKDNRLIGRYALLVEDEAGKININAARAVSPNMQNQGFGTFEIMLTDGKGAGLPVSLDFARNILGYRYGRDREPGQAGVDDNLTESSFAADLIDNDADGFIDQVAEGIDEPGEYDPLKPKWDDRTFSSIREVEAFAMGNKRLTKDAFRVFKKYGTLYTRSQDKYWNESENAWQKQINLNVATKNQLYALFRQANEQARFEPIAKNLRMLVGNVADYRDENHVLMTYGSEYGVEAVCFNEVMANDGSYTLRADWNDPKSYWVDEYNLVHRFGYWYDPEDGNRNKKYGYKILSLGSPSGGEYVYTNGYRVRIPYSVRVTIKDEPIIQIDKEGWSRFKRIRRDAGGWMPDMWKNSELHVYHSTQYGLNRYVSYPILGNTRNALTVGYSTQEEYNYLKAASSSTSEFNSVRINTVWHNNPAGLLGIYPRMTEYFAIPLGFEKDFSPPDNLYYKIFISDQNLPGNMPRPYEGPYKGFNPVLDVDGDPASYSETRMMELHRTDLEGSSLQLPGNQETAWLLRTPYKDGEPQRPKNGFFHVVVSTCNNTGFDGGRNRVSMQKACQNKNIVQAFYMMRPDIVEMINISDHPISLRNWRVVINTGSYADQLGRIVTANHFSRKRNGVYQDPNPVIEPGGYFYLTNYRDVFDKEFGSPKDGTWGNSVSETYPVVEMLDALWGVRYKISSINNNKVTVEGADWEKDQMKYEMSEWHLRQPKRDQNSQFGLRSIIRGNTRNTLIAAEDGVTIVSVKPGDDILILGMPRQGGFLSMTLKNEYNQITARTVTYGSTDYNEFNFSTEKLDPTHYTWRKTAKPTFGGLKRLAHNHWQPRGDYVKPHVKNNRFSSVGEVQKVRKAQDWENVGEKQKGATSLDVLKAIAKYFTVAGERLDPEEKGVHISGWQPAFGRAANSSINTISAEDMQWEPNIWAGQTLRIHTGNLSGESFPIAASSEGALRVDGYSAPGRKELKVRNGDLFSVGPGYATPMFYTRRNGEEGIWEWKKKGLQENMYGLYLFGLNDSIDTTEFLEENYNPQIEVFVYNYDTETFEALPRPEERVVGRSGDPYMFVTGKDRHQYEKSDGVYCGLIHPEHISADGGLKLKLVAHNIDNEKCSGFAWFDYIYLAPGMVNGKININTASERVLQAMRGITPELANNIYNGIDHDRQPHLKPYKNTSDILNVRNMTPEVFSRVCNLITTRSDQYRVQAIAQTLDDVNNDGEYNSEDGDKVLSQSTIEKIVDRRELTDSDPETVSFRILGHQ